MPVRVLSIATAVPPYALDQEAVMARARALFARAGSDIERLLPVFANSGIERRFSCVPLDWYEDDHSWADRNRLYVENALDLLETLARDCAARADIGLDEIDHIVTVSSTGIATPSLDALLMERLAMRDDCQRLPVFGLGCAGGVLGVNRGAALAAGQPGATVLVLVVELCALTFRKNDRRKANIVATALFGDGAAGVLLRNDERAGPRLVAAGEHRWPGTLDIMGWDVTDEGLAVQFSRDIPTLVRERFSTVTDAFLSRNGLPMAQIDGFVCHPGGAKVIEALEEVFGLQSGTMIDARETLRSYGNMSAATVLFVLQRAWKRGLRGRNLLTALGPGFTAAFGVLDAA